jgi:hypothetical protein
MLRQEVVMRARVPAIHVLGASVLISAGARAQGAVAPPAPQPLPPGVFLHIESPLPVQLTEHLGVARTEYGAAPVVRVFERTRAACTSPCDQVLDVRAGHELTLEAKGFPDPGPFRFPRQSGSLTLFVEPGSDGGMAVGRTATAVGGLAFTFGVVAVPFVFKDGPAPVTGFNAFAVGMLVGGAAALAIGIPLLVTQHTRIRFSRDALARVATGSLSF